MSTHWICTICDLLNSSNTTICQACFNKQTQIKPSKEEKQEETKQEETKQEEIDDNLYNLGAGDCELRYNILSQDIANNAFYHLKNEVKWNEMRHKGGLVPRLVANQGIIYSSNNNIEFEPIYRHPATQQPKLIAFTPFVEQIRKLCERHTGHSLNHALIQLYRNGSDYISDHSDKTIDINPHSKIINFSVGATRLFVIKKKKETKNDIKMKYVPNVQRIHLPNNSLLLLGLKTNRFMHHKIQRDKRQSFLKKKDELSFGGQRISITFRKISTFKSRSNPQNILIGQGARFPNKHAVIKVLHNEKKIIFDKEKVNLELVLSDYQKQSEFRHLIYAFGDENRKAASFDWEKTYGRGFSLVL